jgi:hypothetical protein
MKPEDGSIQQRTPLHERVESASMLAFMEQNRVELSGRVL